MMQMNENRKSEQTFTIRQLLPIIVPLSSVAASVLGVTIAFTKVQMESNVNTARLVAEEARLDRFQDAFTVFRAEANKDNRDRDRMIERAAAVNEAQSARIDQLSQVIRELSERSFRARPQSAPEAPIPLDPIREAQKGDKHG